MPAPFDAAFAVGPGRRAPNTALTPEATKTLLDAGESEADIIQRLVASGARTERGAVEIVRLMTTRSVKFTDGGTSEQADTSRWPGPADDPPPLFAA